MLFYFSGTGNSKYVAQKIAQSLGERMISISDCLKKKDFVFTVDDDERIGFVFPTYFYGVPSIVADFTERLELRNYKRQYTYAIVTCGTDCGGLFAEFEKLLFRRGVGLNGGAEVILPDNYILSFNLLPDRDRQRDMFIVAESHMVTVTGQIRDRKLPPVKSSLGRFLKTRLSYPMYKYGRSTKHFYAKDTCDGCGLCERICPIGIITMDDGKPSWRRCRCVQCLACLHRCPQKAIQHKKRTEKRGRYTNPMVTA